MGRHRGDGPLVRALGRRYPMGYDALMDLIDARTNVSAASSCSRPRPWSTQRILFLLAGGFTLTGTALAAGVNRWFALIPAVVGANQLFMVAVGWCPMSKLLGRLLPAPTS